ncbi:hypothetical protein B0919_14765 [Hymenobacter sp. CRA2]|nr:hypothetical protein B0919_14765 [Hymenobacter sp. CRA2]
MLTATAMLLTACGDDPVKPATGTPGLELGSGDAGLLSYVFLLKRFATGFYQAALTTPAADLTAADLAILRDVNRHEIIHREMLVQVFQKNSLVDAPTIGLLQGVAFTYPTATFTITTRQGVLAGARLIEDLSVAALAGTAKLVTSSVVYFPLLMKMLAVDSRHAATMRDLVQPGSFAGPDAVASTGSQAGLNQILTPAAALTELNKYTNGVILTGNSLPTT